MNEEAKQASRVIESVSKAVANWTVSRHAEMNPDLETLYGASWRRNWIAHVESQLQSLVQAVAVRRPVLFELAVTWAQDTFEARDVSNRDLLDSLACLCETLERELPAPVSEVAAGYVRQAIETFEPDRKTPPMTLSDEAPHRKLVLEYLEAVLSGDQDAAQGVIMRAGDEGVPVTEIYERVLAPAQVEIGRMWQAGEITVADEHLASATTQVVMSLLRPRFPSVTKNGRTVVATSVAGDLHEIGVRMVADYFAIGGWNVVYLGPNTPSADIVDSLGARRSDLLALSANTALNLREVGELIEQIRADKECTNTKVILGGSPFTAIPDLWQELGADGCAHSAREAVLLGDLLVPKG